MIQKFITQEETHKSLVAMTKESQAKIEEIAQQKEAAQRRVTEAKYNAGAEEAAPVAVNVTERAKLERQRHKLERLTQVMISVKAGVPRRNTFARFIRKNSRLMRRLKVSTWRGEVYADEQGVRGLCS